MKTFDAVVIGLFTVTIVVLASMTNCKAQGSWRNPNRTPDPTHHEFHEWYKTLHMKERGYQHIKCCDEHDCGKVKFLGWDSKGNPRLLTRYGELTAPFAKIQVQPTPNQDWHACYMRHDDMGDSHITWYCVIAPEGNG